MSKQPVTKNRFNLDGDEPIRDNITTPAPAAAEGGAKNRFINFRVSNDRFIEIKTAALHQGLSLGDYLILTHEKYQK